MLQLQEIIMDMGLRSLQKILNVNLQKQEYMLLTSLRI